MASITEQLKWLIDADASSAISAFQKTGAAAETSLGKAESSTAKIGAGLTKFGAGAAATAGVIGGALVKAAGSFEDLALSAGKFSTTTGVSVQSASRWIEVTGDMGVSSDTLESSMNKMNKTLGATPAKFDEYGVAVARTKDGNVDVEATFLNVIDRLNEIPDASDKARVANDLLGKNWTGLSDLIAEGSGNIKASLAAVSDQKVIDPEELQRAKDYRDSLDTLKDSAESLVLAIGEGAAPVIGGFAKALGTAGQKIADLNAISDGAVGRIAAIGAAGLGLVGVLSTVAGQVTKMSSRFTDGEGAMTGFGKAATGVGIALGTIAAAQVVFATIDQIRGVHQLTDEYNAFLTALGKKPSSLGVLTAFDTLTTQVGNNISTMEAGKRDLDAIFSGNNVNTWALDANTAFEQLRATSLDAADQVVTGYEKLLAAAKGGNQAAIDAIRARGLDTQIIGRWRTEVNNAKGAQDALTGSTKDGKAVVDDSTDAWTKYGEKLADWVAKTNIADLTIQAFGDTLNKQADSAAASTKANLDLNDAYDTLDDSVKKNGKTFSDHTEKGRANIQALLGVGSAIRDNLIVQLNDSGGSYEQVTAAADLYRQQLVKQMTQAGLSANEQQHYLEVLGLTPKQVQTAIELSGQAAALSAVTALNIQLDDFDDPKARTAYVEAIARGDYKTALGIVQTMTEANSKTITYTIHTVTSGGPGFHPQVPAIGGTVGRGGGIAGEAGPEIAKLPGKRLPVLLTAPTFVPPGTQVTSTSSTARILKGRKPPKFYANGTGSTAVAADASMQFTYNQNAPVYGVEDLNRHLEQWSNQLAQKISVGKR